MNNYEIYIRYGFIENGEVIDENDFTTIISAADEGSAVSIAKLQLRETRPYEIGKICVRKI